MTLEEQLWSCFFMKPEIFEKYVEEIYEKSFIWSEKQVYKLFLHYYNEAELNQLSIDLLRGIDQLYERYSINILQLESKGEIDVSEEIDRLFKRIVESYVSERRRALELLLQKYDKEAPFSEEHLKLMKEFNQLKKI